MCSFTSHYLGRVPSNSHVSLILTSDIVNHDSASKLIGPYAHITAPTTLKIYIAACVRKV